MTPIQPSASRRTLATAVLVGLTLPAGAAVAHADQEVDPAERSQETIAVNSDDSEGGDKEESNHTKEGQDANGPGAAENQSPEEDDEGGGDNQEPAPTPDPEPENTLVDPASPSHDQDVDDA